MKVCYISNTSFADSDMGIVKSLYPNCKVCYAVVVPFTSNNFSVNQLKGLIQTHDDIVIKEVLARGRQRNPLNLLAYYRWLRSLKIGSYDVVYISNTEDIFLSVLLFFYTLNKRVIYGVHDAVNHSGWRTNFLMKAANKLLFYRSYALLSFSKLQSKVLMQQFPKKKVFSIPLMLKDFGEVKSASNSYTVINFLFFGNIASYKGLDLLLDSVKQLSKKYKNFSLTIAGRCKEWHMDYEQLVNDDMPVKKHIRFIDNEEIPKFFSEAHYLVLPYRDVTQSGPLMIAYNYNVPVLASQLEGFAEFIEEGKSGYFFKPDDVDSLRNVMEAAIVRGGGAYQQLRENTAVFAKQKFSPQTISSQYTNMFEQVGSDR